MSDFHKTTVEIDLEQLERAQAALKTDGIKDTVNAALREVSRKAALEEAADYVLAGKLHVPDAETWAAQRQPRV